MCLYGQNLCFDSLCLILVLCLRILMSQHSVLVLWFVAMECFHLLHKIVKIRSRFQFLLCIIVSCRVKVAFNFDFNVDL